MENRWQTILQIWDDNRWLFGLGGILIGIVTGIVIGLSLANADAALLAFVDGIWPEVISTTFAVAVLDQLNRRRDDRNRIRALQERLVRELRSNVEDVAKQAVFELYEQGWLHGKNGALKEANLRNAQLEGTNLTKANLQEADLFQTNLTGANLWSANLKSASLAFADLQGANLSSANLQRAKLPKAKLSRADLSSADLHDAYLDQADLRDVNLKNADLRRADLRDAYLKGANLVDTIYDKHTLLPDAEIIGIEQGNILYNTYWTSDTDMTRYTDPNHPDFWQPGWVKDDEE